MAASNLVVLFALIKKNKILLEKRPVEGFSEHQYLIPGGTINSNREDLENALKREVKEELGITPTEFALLTDEDIPGLHENILKPYVVTSWQGEIPQFILDKEDPFPLKWIEIDKVINLLPIEPTKKIIAALKSYLSKQQV